MLFPDYYLSFLYRMEYTWFWAEIFMLGSSWHVLLAVIFTEFCVQYKYKLLLYAFVNTCLIKLNGCVICHLCYFLCALELVQSAGIVSMSQV
jgi:hypothetical protein